MQVKVLSWNIWVDGRFEECKALLNRVDADVIGLQEVQDNDAERDVIGFLTTLGYRHVFAMTEHTRGGKTYRIGPALFTRLPLVNSGTFLVNDSDPRAVAWMDIEMNGKIAHVFNTHLVHTHQKESSAQEGEAVRLIEKLPTENTIVIGDFNATPESAVIRRMNEVLVNTDPSLSPTWSVYREGCHTCNPQAVLIRLDYIFASKDLKTNSPAVEDSKGSDHLPISVVVEV